MKRILITGSQTWADELVISNAIIQWAVFHNLSPAEITIIHGGARGADAMAHRFASRHGIAIEEHPADWRPDGHFNRAAGHERNAEMVALGADVCLAFIKGGSSGATGCAKLAEAAGIEVLRYEEE